MGGGHHDGQRGEQHGGHDGVRDGERVPLVGVHRRVQGGHGDHEGVRGGRNGDGELVLKIESH